MKTNTSYKVNAPDVVYEEIEGDLVVLNLRKGTYYSFNSSGTWFFNALEAGKDLDWIKTCFKETYKNIDGEEIENTLSMFFNELMEEGIVVMASEACAPPEEDRTLSLLSNYVSLPLPAFESHTNLKDLLLLDPIHEISPDGWPNVK